MTARLLRRFLRDRLGLAGLLAVNTGVLLALGGLVLAYAGRDAADIRMDLAYGALLSATLLLLYLGVDLLRWWAFARQAEELLTRPVNLSALANLPAGGTPEQALTRALVTKLHGLAVTEVERHQAVFDRHRAFMNLWVHQMKTPVAAISLIAQQTRDPEDVVAAMANVDEEAAKLADGLELVLNMARLSDFAVDYQIRRTDLLAAVRKVINGRKQQFIRLGVFPEVIAEAGEWSVLTDDKWNGFIIDQIVANALKYGAQSGKPDQRVTLTLLRLGDRVTLTVADRGPGIPPQDLPRIYEPFFTGENGRRFAQATGIGLYLVKQVTDRLGHAIAVASTEGVGTAVTVTYLTKL